MACTVTGTWKRQRGFSLLEVLIALIIAGLALATLFRAAGESIHGTAVAARYQEAVSRARSRLDAVGASLQTAEQSGDDGGGFHWRTLARPLASTGKLDSGGRPTASTDALVVSLYAVTVWVTWREGPRTRTLRLDSQRLLTSAPG
jgi:prepilin-type N-terminal cleavage/methylation domain-containing protein